ncbi:MAG TPA: STAS domain-containing protein [Chthoniobacterales bacterium]|jgi:anti-anti-sigma factor|nr:STAS domain-containing protein [Chthoniobacterales bacterium]
MARPTATANLREAFASAYVIDLAGELTSTAESAVLNAYQHASDNHARVLILNFSQLTYKNTSGAKLLVGLLARGNAAGQRIFATGLTEGYRNIFRVTQIDQGIPIYDTEADALRAAHKLLGEPGSPPIAPTTVAPAQPAARKRPTDSWAEPVDRLEISQAPIGALALNVEGRRLFGPLQGFGQLWQKTYRIGLRDVELTPRQVIAAWKENVPKLKPAQKHFYPSVAGIMPNELVLIDARTPGGPVSTGVMVLYASADSFTLMTPAGHPEAGWVTFSSYVQSGRTFAQVQVMARAGDPLYELAFRLVGSKLQDGIWVHVLTALATHLGTSGEVEMQGTLLDSKFQWGRIWNIWYNAQLRTLLYSPIALLRWMMGHFRPKNRGGTT